MKTQTENSRLVTGVTVEYIRIGFNPETEQTQFIAKITTDKGTESFDYSMGIGCRDKEKERKLVEKWEKDKSYSRNYEFYKQITWGKYKAAKNLDHKEIMEVFNALSSIANPDYFGILYCLNTDSEACNMSFEDFCGNFGYDEDSRKAEGIYHACKENGRKFYRILSKEQREKIQELSQDY